MTGISLQGFTQPSSQACPPLVPSPSTLLLSGFHPFAGDPFNPSGHIAASLHGHLLLPHILVRSLILPVSGPPAFRKLSHAIRVHRPRWIVAMGVSSRAEISLESTAWNEEDYAQPDNSGRRPRGVSILKRGPLQLHTGFGLSPRDVQKFSSGLAIRASTDPGRFVCNHLYYRLLHLTRNPQHYSHGKVIFIHLPSTPEMRRGPCDARFFYPLAPLQEIVRKLLQKVVHLHPDHERISNRDGEIKIPPQLQRGRLLPNLNPWILKNLENAFIQHAASGRIV